MSIKPITCDTLIRTVTFKDRLFHGNYTLDPYQNCAFQCSYCDSSLDTTIFVKINAPEHLEQALPSLKKGIVIIGSVNDAYQAAERDYLITRKLLMTLKKHGFPCHIITKSTLIERDLDLVTSMNCIVTISLLTLDSYIHSTFEKNVDSPQNRLHILKLLHDKGVYSGIAFIPFLPYISEPDIEPLVAESKKHGAQYFLHAPLELRGDQREIFFMNLKTAYPQLLRTYTQLYHLGVRPDDSYMSQIDTTIAAACQKYRLPQKINHLLLHDY